MKTYALVAGVAGALLAFGGVVEGYAIVAFALCWYLFADEGDA